jgi:hypothetical protein
MCKSGYYTLLFRFYIGHAIRDNQQSLSQQIKKSSDRTPGEKDTGRAAASLFVFYRESGETAIIF